MRGEDHVVEPAQRRLERVTLLLRLDREDVESSTGDVPGQDPLAQRLGVDDHAAGSVDEHRAGLHLVELLRAEQPGVAGATVDVQRDDVGLGEQGVQRRHPARVAVGESVGGVVEDHAQPERLGDDRELRADVAVADDAEHPAADLVGALGGLVPQAVVHLLRLLRQSSRERDDLADDELDDAAGVGVGRVEGSDPVGCGRVEVDLVGADAEGPDREQIGVLDDLRGQVGPGADAEQLHTLQRLDQVVLAQGARTGLDLDPRRLEDLVGAGVDAFEQECLHDTRIRGRRERPFTYSTNAR